MNFCRWKYCKYHNVTDTILFILDFFSSREWATITIIGGFILYCFVSSKTVRASMYQIVMSFVAPKVLLPVLGAYIYLSVFTFFLYKLGLWSTIILRETILFYLFTCVALLFRYVLKPLELASRKYWNDALSILVVIEIYINTYTFSYFAELLFQVGIMITWLMANADMVTKKKTRTQGCSRVVYYVFLSFAFIYSVCRLVTAGMNNFSYDMVVSIVYPVVGTALYYPYLYLLAVYVEYDLWMIVIERSARGDLGEYKRRRKAVIKCCRLNLSKISIIKGDFKPFLANNIDEFVAELKACEIKYQGLRV